MSFDLLNEPGDIPPDTYVRVVKRLVEAIRAEDPQRLVIADGLKWGSQPVFGLVDLGIAQSTRGYEPVQISHYKASWMHGSDTWPEPTWPLKRGEKPPMDKETLRRERIEPWKKLEQKGVGVHVGEWGAFNRTPHKVVLAWMRDNLDLWKLPTRILSILATALGSGRVAACVAWDLRGDGVRGGTENPRNGNSNDVGSPETGCVVTGASAVAAFRCDWPGTRNGPLRGRLEGAVGPAVRSQRAGPDGIRRSLAVSGIGSSPGQLCTRQPGDPGDPISALRHH